MIRILYTDDEPDLLEIGKIFLEQEEDLEVSTKICVADSLDTLATCHYDAIVSDFRMPGTDGIQFLKIIRSKGNGIPFILFTGQGREEVAIEALNNGADFYVQKGGNPAAQFTELIHKIRMSVAKRRDQERIHRLNRALRMFIECNRIIHISMNELELYQKCCEAIITMGGYRFVWIGNVEYNGETSVRPVAYAGFEEGYLSSVKIAWAEHETGAGHTRRAIITKRPAIARDLEEDFNDKWRDEAKRRGYASSITIPFLCEGTISRVLKIYSCEPDAFDREEEELLTRMGEDICYGAIAIRNTGKSGIPL
jgi:DNA-binding response OmpR family regulator